MLYVNGAVVGGGVLGAAAAGAAAIHFASPKIPASEYANSEIIPQKRGIKFIFDQSDISNWNGYGRFTSIFMNSLSIFFPVGEAFFVRAVLAHKERAGVNSDEKLREQVSAFVSQEAIHGREHDRYNDEIKKKYPHYYMIERIGGHLLQFSENVMGTRRSLAVTVALEHWTGLLGGALLEVPSIYNLGDQKVGLVWHWHAMEESEHKAVAFDVYSRCYGYNVLSWADKAFALVMSTILLWSLTWAGFLGAIWHDGIWWNLNEWFMLLWVQWGTTWNGEPVGIFRKCVRPFFHYFHPAYHPWKWAKPNEREMLLQSMKEFEKELEVYKEETSSGSDTAKKESGGGKPANGEKNEKSDKHIQHSEDYQKAEKGKFEAKKH